MPENIIVTEVFPPIPTRDFDYSATRGPWDLGKPIGHGSTPEKAIADLLEAEELVK